MSQRALQAHSDRLLGYTDLDGVGFVVSEVSPYEADLDWTELTEPDEIDPVVDVARPGHGQGALRRATPTPTSRLVEFQTEDAVSHAVGGREDEFVDWVVDFAHSYAAQARDRSPAVRRGVPERPGARGVGDRS